MSLYSSCCPNDSYISILLSNTFRIYDWLYAKLLISPELLVSISLLHPENISISGIRSVISPDRTYLINLSSIDWLYLTTSYSIWYFDRTYTCYRLHLSCGRCSDCADNANVVHTVYFCPFWILCRPSHWSGFCNDPGPYNTQLVLFQKKI